jgi:glutamyl-tRNA reductase
MAGGEQQNIILAGLSHRSAPVEVREQIAFEEGAYAEVLATLTALPGVAECVCISTCNRTEFYCVVTGDPDVCGTAVISFLAERGNGYFDPDVHCYLKIDESAITHLFRVVAGLDSMVLGEPQIFGQVKTAYTIAAKVKSTGPVSNRLFHHAFRVGKTIRHETGIGEGTVSVGAAAVSLATDVLGGLAGRSVILAGAGKVAELCAKRLVDAGVTHLAVANRTPERSQELADSLNGTTIPFETLAEHCADADILITSVGAQEPILDREDLTDALAGRTGDPLVIVDLGVPRNVAVEVGELDMVRLYNIDALEGYTLENIDRRQMEAEKAEALVAEETAVFSDWHEKRHMAPVIRELHDSCETLRRDELERVRNRIDDDTFALLESVSHRIIRKLLHNPVITMQGASTEVERKKLAESIRELFIPKADD